MLPPPQSFETIEELAAFWDEHSTADYEDLMEEVEVEVNTRSRRVYRSTRNPT